jgi:hypothetical protein
MTPDKFFANYVFDLNLTFFGTRFGKIDMRGDILETLFVKEIWHFMRQIIATI